MISIYFVIFALALLGLFVWDLIYLFRRTDINSSSKLALTLLIVFTGIFGTLLYPFIHPEKTKARWASVGIVFMIFGIVAMFFIDLGAGDDVRLISQNDRPPQKTNLKSYYSLCMGNQASACMKLSEIYQNGYNGVEKNESYAAYYLKKSCNIAPRENCPQKSSVPAAEEESAPETTPTPSVSSNMPKDTKILINISRSELDEKLGNLPQLLKDGTILPTRNQQTNKFLFCFVKIKSDGFYHRLGLQIKDCIVSINDKAIETPQDAMAMFSMFNDKTITKHVWKVQREDMQVDIEILIN